MGNISWSNAGGLSWSHPILGAGVVKLARWASHWVGNLSASKCVWKRLTRNDDHVIYSFGIKLSKYLLLKSVEWWVLHSTGTFAVILRSTTTSMKFRTDISKKDWQNLLISLICWEVTMKCFVTMGVGPNVLADCILLSDYQMIVKIYISSMPRFTFTKRMKHTFILFLSWVMTQSLVSFVLRTKRHFLHQRL